VCDNDSGIMRKSRADYEQIVQVPGVKLANFANYFPATYQIPTQNFPDWRIPAAVIAVIPTADR
jgi:hypothetical protein